jgi:hypothetical protein
MDQALQSHMTTEKFLWLETQQALNAIADR